MEKCCNAVLKMRNLEFIQKKKIELKAWIDEYSVWIKETNPVILKKTFEKMLNNAGFGVLKFIDHHFSPQGYTGLWLIEESHFAVHTFPEEEKTYIQLSSCNREMYFLFLDLMKTYQLSE